jgi:hypothetical protein
MVSLSFSACSRGFRTTIPHPSPRPYPVPRLSNAKDLPSSENRLVLLGIFQGKIKQAYRDMDMDIQNSGDMFR